MAKGGRGKHSYRGRGGPRGGRGGGRGGGGRSSRGGYGNGGGRNPRGKRRGQFAEFDFDSDDFGQGPTIGYSMREEASHTDRRHFMTTSLRSLTPVVFISAGFMEPDEILKRHEPDPITELNDPSNLIVEHTYVDDMLDMMQDDEDDEADFEGENGEEDNEEGREEEELGPEEFAVSNDKPDIMAATVQFVQTTEIHAGAFAPRESTISATQMSFQHAGTLANNFAIGNNATLPARENVQKFLLARDWTAKLTCCLSNEYGDVPLSTEIIHLTPAPPQTTANGNLVPHSTMSDSDAGGSAGGTSLPDDRIHLYLSSLPKTPPVPITSDDCNDPGAIKGAIEDMRLNQIVETHLTVSPAPPPVHRPDSPAPSDVSEEICFVPRNQRGKKQALAAVTNSKGIEPPVEVKETVKPTTDSNATVEPPGDHEKADVNAAITADPQEKPPATELRVHEKIQESIMTHVERQPSYKSHSAPSYKQAQKKKAADRRRKRKTIEQEEEDALVRDYIENMTMEDMEGLENFRPRDLGLDDGNDMDIDEDEDDEGDEYEEGYDASSQRKITGKAKNLDQEFIARLDESTASDVEGEIDAILHSRVRDGVQQYLVQFSVDEEDPAENLSFWAPFDKLDRKGRRMVQEFKEARAMFGDSVQAGIEARIRDAEAAQKESGAGYYDDEDMQNASEVDEEEDEDASEDDDDDDEAGMENEEYIRLTEMAKSAAFGSDYENRDYSILLDYENEDEDEDEGDEEADYSIDNMFSIAPNRKGQYPSASRLADAYDEFDIMDRNRASIRNGKKKGKKGKLPPQFSTGDSELDAQLESTWEKDRLKKKLRKQQRQEVRHGNRKLKPPQIQGLDKYSWKEELWTEDFDDLNLAAEIEEFILGENDILVLPPCDNIRRQRLHKLSERIGGLLSKSYGNEKMEGRFVTFRKRPEFYPIERSQIRILFSDKRFNVLFRRSEVYIKSEAKASFKSSVHVKAGHVVGRGAPEIAQDNKGRKMLEKMGYKTGMGLGANSKGIMAPIEAVVRQGKAGLG